MEEHNNNFEIEEGSISDKIESWAGIYATIAIISSLIAGIYLIAAGSDYGGDETLVFVGISVVVVGILGSIFTSTMIKGFAKLIENSEKIVDSLSVLVENSNITKEKAEMIRKSTGFTAKVLHDSLCEDESTDTKSNQK